MRSRPLLTGIIIPLLPVSYITCAGRQENLIRQIVILIYIYSFSINRRPKTIPAQIPCAGQSVEEAGVKREQNTGFFEIEVQKEGEGEGNRADGNPATSV